MNNVNFNARFSDSKYCACNCCNAVNRVMMLEIPVTKYSKESKYMNLETKYKTYWMCDECRNALTTLLDRLKEIEND